jgi:hypothetical protein
MESIGHHLMFRLLDDRVIVPSTGKRRVLARTVYRLAEPAGLVGFGVADTHLHLALRCDRRRAGKLAHDLCCALHFAIEPLQHFERTRIKRIDNQRHLENVLNYALRQRRHHGILVDALRDGTSLPELLGLRVLARGSVLRVRELLPRLTRETLAEHLGPRMLEPAGALELERDSIPDILDAAAGCVGLVDLGGVGSQSRGARAALLQLPADGPLRSELVQRMRLTRGTAWRLSTMPVPADHERALRLQLGLRRWLREHGQRDEDSLG